MKAASGLNHKSDNLVSDKSRAMFSIFREFLEIFTEYWTLLCKSILFEAVRSYSHERDLVPMIVALQPYLAF